MDMLRKIGRLFVIKTRWEAWMVIYAIAVGAVERGQHYLQSYPGYGGWMLAVACTGVVFLAGARLLDSVKPAPTPALAGIYQPRLQRRRDLTGSRPRSRRPRFDSAPRRSLHKD
jgi:hypothetical protein